MKKMIIATAFILAALGPVRSFAWGKTGHGLVAEVAFTMVDANVKEQVRKYLGTMTIEQAANWMDDIRSDHRNDYMKTWHYVNVAKGSTYGETREENVVNQLTRVIKELEHRDKMSDEDIKKDLLIVFHLVGDLHQPLHTGYGEDKGGNAIQVNYNGHSTNLHKVWDSEIIDNEHITLAGCLAQGKHFDKDDIAGLSAIDPAAWMRQPRSQLNGVYSFTDDKIDEAYVARNKRIIEEDIYIAGVRLAAVLKDIFKS